MKSILKKMKDKKGFTLVELIVVLVILAILAALLVPSLTGYIDRARNQSIISETRSAVMAAQTIASEKYGEVKNSTGTAVTDEYMNTDTVVAEIMKLAELDNKGIKISDIKIAAKGVIASLKLENANGDVCVYSATPTGDADTYEVTPKA